MIVLNALLPLWKQQEHRVLLFSQSRQMLDIIEKYVSRKKYRYMRMDGMTPTEVRQKMIEQFNTGGGLGVNLTGADRIIIFDPDWNPTTDLQARERAWRIGQERQVTIYRLLTTGTIEEKIYHRQVYKQCLTNKVLKDPMQRRLLPSSDLQDLFSLSSYSNTEGTLSSALFAGTGSEIRMKKLLRRYNRFDAKEKGANPSDVLKERAKAIKQRAGTVKEEDKPAENKSGHVKEKKDEAKQAKNEAVSAMIIPKTAEERRELARILSRKMEEEKRKKEVAAIASCAGKETASSGDRQSSLHHQHSEEERGRRSSTENHPPKSDGHRKSSSEHKHHRSEGGSRNTHDDGHHMSHDDGHHMSHDNGHHMSHDNGHHMSHKDRRESSGKRSEGEKRGSSEHRHSESERRNSMKHGHHQSEARSSSKHHHSKLEKQGSKESEKGRHRSKDKKDAKFEGHRIPHLVKTGVYEIAAKEEDKPGIGQDDYVLMKLLKSSGVQSAMHHDRIVDGGYSDHTLVIAEAEKTARAAVAALKLSRAHCHSAMSGNPDNLGGDRIGASTSKAMPKFGQKKNSLITQILPPSPKPAPPPQSATPSRADQTKEKAKKSHKRKRDKEEKQFGQALFDGSEAGFSSLVKTCPATSEKLLAKMNEFILMPGAEESNFEGDPAYPSAAAARAPIVKPEVMEMLSDVRHFIAVQARVNGEASYQELWAHFRSHIRPEEETKFQAMVKELCDLVKVNGKSVWKLKYELR